MVRFAFRKQGSGEWTPGLRKLDPEEKLLRVFMKIQRGISVMSKNIQNNLVANSVLTLTVTILDVA
jgi:hypothetical protein